MSGPMSASHSSPWNAGQKLDTPKLYRETPHFYFAIKVLHKIGATAPVERMLRDAEIPYEVFDRVEPNPTINQVFNIYIW